VTWEQPRAPISSAQRLATGFVDRPGNHGGYLACLYFTGGPHIANEPSQIEI
jgi:hypothetical protein